MSLSRYDEKEPILSLVSKCCDAIGQSNCRLIKRLIMPCFHVGHPFAQWIRTLSHRREDVTKQQDLSTFTMDVSIAIRVSDQFPKLEVLTLGLHEYQCILHSPTESQVRGYCGGKCVTVNICSSQRVNAQVSESKV
jgi:hypothetical protein